MSLFSLLFIVFIAVLTAIYYLVPKKAQWLVLAAASLLFYVLAGGVKASVFLIGSSLVTWFASSQMQKITDRYDELLKTAQKEEKKELKQKAKTEKKKYMLFAVIANLVLLGYVKYFNFLGQQLNHILKLIHIPAVFKPFEILLPLGISFYVFQSVGYLIDVYKGKVRAEKSYPKTLLFVSYFPQMVQGPISSFKDLGEQLYAPHDFDYMTVKNGMLRTLWGYIKKIVIADRIAIVVADVFTNYAAKGYNGGIIFLGVILYGFQIYADFSGGIDIIMGVSESLGITLQENFRQPYFATSVSEFWNRWHMTLGTWIKNYVFYPLALSKPFMNLGKKCRKVFSPAAAKVIPTSIASLISFLLVGLWHGAAWKYVAFGMYQAFFVSTGTLFEKFYAKMRKFFRINESALSWKAFQILRTTAVITGGRYLSRSRGLSEAFRLWKITLKKFHWGVLFDGSMLKLGLDERNINFMIVSIIILLLVDAAHEKGFRFREWIAKQDIVVRWVIYLAAIFSIIIFGIYGQEFNAANFIYQGF